MAVIVYLDTTAYAHIYGKIGCTGADIAQLRKAIYGRELSIRLSVHTLAEILLAHKVSPQGLAAQIKLTLSLANSRTLIKPCEQLLRDDIQSYAARGEADRPFLRGDTQNAISAGLAELIESDGEELEDEFAEVLQESQQQKQQFLAMLEQARHMLPSIAGQVAERMSFDQYFETAAKSAVEVLAGYVGAGDACRRRGLEGLLHIKSVRMSLIAALGSSYTSANPASPASIHHAVSAAAVADRFVCDDILTRQLLSRAPNDNFEVITLPEFLKRLP
jgi:hypothetical protein